MYISEILAVLGAYIVSVIVLYVLLIIANWKIFTKAGEAGWKSIIPFYNVYILYKISWKTSMFWIMLLIAILSAILTSLANIAAAVIGTILVIISSVISIIQYYKLSKAYGHGIGFTIGLVLLNPIFMLILGLGSSQYVGKSEN